MMTTHAAENASARTIVAVLYLLLFCFATNLFIIGAILPQLVDQIGVTAKQGGYLIAAYAIPAAVCNLVAGPLSDKFGRKRILGIAAAGFALTTLGCSIAPNYSSLLIMRALNGIAAAPVIGCAYAYAGDFSRQKNSSRLLGLLTSSIYLGNGLGIPAIMQINAALNWRAGFALIAVLSTVAAIGVVRCLPSIPTGAEHISIRPAAVMRRYRTLLSYTRTRVLLAFTFLVFVIMYSLNTFIGFWATRSFGFDVTDVGILFFASGAMSVLASVLAHTLIQRFGAEMLVIGSCVIAAAVHALIGQFGSVALLAVAFGWISFLFTARLIALQAAVAGETGAVRGILGASFTAASQVGMALSPVICSALLSRYDFEGQGHGYIELNIVLSVVLVFTGCLWVLYRRAPAISPI